MSDFENKNVTPLTEESVDDILAGILNPDGSFNDAFNGLLKKYVGGDGGENPLPVLRDISDRTDEVPAAASAASPATRVEYEEPGDITFADRRDADERIEEKLSESIRAAYAEAAASVQRPEFTSTGDVKYPVMGSGASEERVIYDADWEETARKEAQRLQRVRQDRMLRGDNAYARGYFSEPATYARSPYMVNPYMQDNSPQSEYIDPLSRDEDFERVNGNSQFYSSAKKSFFSEGFSAAQRNNYASGGKTERTRSLRSDFAGAPAGRDTSWLQVEEKPQKKRGLFSKKKSAPAARKSVPSVEEAIENLERERLGINNSSSSASAEEAAPVRAAVDSADILAVEQETAGLRSTVAEIVDKYNKRSEEDERRRIEEEARLENERRQEELRERRRLEEIRQAKENLSPVLREAVETADAEADFDEYEDFSTDAVDTAESKEEAPRKFYGVVFDPSVFNEEEESTEELTEKITADN